ncbi:hypothetical protein Tco_0322397 [Tanacetum coccineum]
MGVTYGQPLSDPSNAQGGNPYIRGTSAYYHCGAYAPQSPMRNNIPTYNRYTDDTLKILGLHEEQRISGFVHGQKIRSLAELKRIKKGKAKGSDTQQGDQKKRDKNAAPIEAPILMINREDRTPKIKSMEESINGIGEITFPHPSLRSLKVDLKVPLVGFSGEHSWPLREVLWKFYNGDSLYKNQVISFFHRRVSCPPPTAGKIRQMQNEWLGLRIEEAKKVLSRFHEGGIRATPSKVKAVTDLEIPKTLKDIQSLNGNLAALSRFLSKGAEKSLPFFKALKSCTDKKTIQWTADAEKAFQRMKKFMEILPTLIVPRRLQRYFQAYPIRVLTDAPIKQTLANPKKSGRKTTERIIQIKQRIQTTRDRQKSYADLKHKPIEFQVKDKVMLKVSPWKGVVRFGKRGKLNPKKVGAVAYKLELPQELSRVHNTFHVSNLKKCYSDDPLVVPLEGLQVDDKLHFVEEPVEIMDREVKQLRRSRVPIVKVRWNSRRGPEFTWEREDQFRKKYPHLFTKTAPSSSAVS